MNYNLRDVLAVKDLVSEQVTKGRDPYDTLLQLREVVHFSGNVVPRIMGKPKQLWEFTSDKHQSKINEKIDYYVGMLVELGIDPDDDLQEFLMALERDHTVTIQTRGLSKDINALEDAVYKLIIDGKDPYDLLSELRDIVENAENLTPPWRGYNLSPTGSEKHKLTDDIKKRLIYYINVLMEEFELDTDVLHEFLRAIGTKHLSGNPKTWIGNPWDDVDDI